MLHFISAWLRHTFPFDLLSESDSFLFSDGTLGSPSSGALGSPSSGVLESPSYAITAGSTSSVTLGSPCSVTTGTPSSGGFKSSSDSRTSFWKSNLRQRSEAHETDSDNATSSNGQTLDKKASRILPKTAESMLIKGLNGLNSETENETIGAVEKDIPLTKLFDSSRVGDNEINLKEGIEMKAEGKSELEETGGFSVEETKQNKIKESPVQKMRKILEKSPRKRKQIALCENLCVQI